MCKVICRLLSIVIIMLCVVILATQIVQCKHVAKKAHNAKWHEMSIEELGERVLIISPHPDDEALACGGLIALLSRRGVSTKVLFVTLGEGFTIALKRELHTAFASAQERMRFAMLRADEARRALRILGCNSVSFLGIPETAMGRIWFEPSWNGCLSSKNALKTSLSCPLSEDLKPIPLCPDKIIDELKRLLIEFNPTSVFIPHRHDDHIVHWVTNVLSLTALIELIREGKLSNSVGVYEYLVHFGRYPTPQGIFKRLPLLPPKMLYEGAKGEWLLLDLPTDVIELKAKAIASYESQRSLTWRFMSSFIRSTEVFERADVTEHKESIVWIPDRKHEPVMPAVCPSADITSVMLRRDSNLFVVRIRTRSKPSEHFSYRLCMLKLLDGIRQRVLISVSGDLKHMKSVGINSSVVSCERDENEITFILLPKGLLPPSTLLITCEVIWHERVVDRTAPIIIATEPSNSKLTNVNKPHKPPIS